MRELIDLLPHVLAQFEESQRLCLQVQNVIQQLGGTSGDLRRAQRIMQNFDIDDPRALRAMNRLSLRSSFEMNVAALTAERLTEVEQAIGSARATLALTATFWAEVPKRRERERDFEAELEAAQANLEWLVQFWALPKKRRPGRPPDSNAAIAYMADRMAWYLSGERIERLDLAAVEIVAGFEPPGNEQWRRSRVAHWGNLLRARRSPSEEVAQFIDGLPPQAQSIVEGMRREVSAIRASTKKTKPKAIVSRTR
jgi:hypothetical protein